MWQTDDLPPSHYFGSTCEEGGFAGIGVADNGDDGKLLFMPLGLLLVAMFPDLLQRCFKMGNSVRTRRRLISSFVSPVPGLLSPLSNGTWPCFSLQGGAVNILTGPIPPEVFLPGSGLAGENVQYQLGSVNDFYLNLVRNRPNLRGCQLLVENEKGGSFLKGNDGQFFDFSSSIKYLASIWIFAG